MQYTYLLISNCYYYYFLNEHVHAAVFLSIYSRSKVCI